MSATPPLACFACDASPTSDRAPLLRWANCWVCRVCLLEARQLAKTAAVVERAARRQEVVR